MAKQLDLNGRRFWIMSDPHGAGWKAFVVEVTADQRQEEIGIEATAETRTAADDAAERKLRRMLQAY
jgi:ribosome-associated translation inhibitor RaiA